MIYIVVYFVGKKKENDQSESPPLTCSPYPYIEGIGSGVILKSPNPYRCYVREGIFLSGQCLAYVLDVHLFSIVYFGE